MTQALKPADFHVLLALADGPLHGYAIMKEVESESDGQVRLEVGSLYRLIERLLDEKLILEAEGDERRRCYRISHSGRKALRAEAQRLVRLADLVRARKLLPAGDA